MPRRELDPRERAVGGLGPHDRGPARRNRSRRDARLQRRFLAVVAVPDRGQAERGLVLLDRLALVVEHRLAARHPAQRRRPAPPARPAPSSRAGCPSRPSIRTTSGPGCPRPPPRAAPRRMAAAHGGCWLQRTFCPVAHLAEIIQVPCGRAPQELLRRGRRVVVRGEEGGPAVDVRVVATDPSSRPARLSPSASAPPSPPSRARARPASQARRTAPRRSCR